MDRIENLLNILHAESSWEMVATGTTYNGHFERRRELQSQIADEWWGMYEALEELLSAGPCDLCYEDPCDPAWCECKCHKRELDARERAQTALARARGGEHG